MSNSNGTIRRPPVAAKRPTRIEAHGDVRIDSYFWLRDREDAEVHDYLVRENEYTAAMMSHTELLQASLIEELRARMKEDDTTAPYRRGRFFYYARYKRGAEYPIYCRKAESMEAREQQILDVNELAAEREYCHVIPTVSPDHNVLAFAVDWKGRRIYDLYFKDLRTGEMLADIVEHVTGNQRWANDSRTVFLTTQHAESLRWDKVLRKSLGDDELFTVYEEKDEAFFVHVDKSRSNDFIFIGSTSTLSSEYRLIDANRPLAPARLFCPREEDMEYHPEHGGDRFYIHTNFEAKNFRLMEAPLEATDKDAWREVLPHREDVLLEWVEVFKDSLVAVEKESGLTQLQVIDRATGENHRLRFPEPAYAVSPHDNYEYDSPTVRYVYESLKTPETTYDYDIASRVPALVKREEVGGGFDPDDYCCERVFAPAGSGVQIPISLVYRAGTLGDCKNGLLLYAYGAYGISSEPRFDSDRISLLDRGIAFAIAHVRGGSELGRGWYEDGRLLNKRNSFEDFITCSDYLIEHGYCAPDRLYAMGASAGGLLVGAVINVRPDLYRGAIAAVPFVDVLTSMLDEGLPLTSVEYDEWGNPHEKEYYDYILSYSPYDNVAPRAYPHLLVTTGLHDPAVQFWEPAKWVAKLRDSKTDSNVLLLKTRMAAGHHGVSGRYRRLEDMALTYAFLLDLDGSDTEAARPQQL